MRAQYVRDVCRGCDRNVPRTGPRRRPCAQHRRSGELRRTGDHQRRARRAFIGFGRAHRQQPQERIVVERGEAARLRRQNRFVDSDRRIPQLADEVARRVEKKPGLRGADRHGDFRTHGAGADRAGQRIDAAWDIDRKYPVPARVERAGKERVAFRHRQSRTRAEQPIDRDRAVECFVRGGFRLR